MSNVINIFPEDRSQKPVSLINRERPLPPGWELLIVVALSLSCWVAGWKILERLCLPE